VVVVAATPAQDQPGGNKHVTSLIKEVDSGNVFIFGHSMGGAFGPMIAVEDQVKGLVVYGVAAWTWFEYVLDTVHS
jgi:pimeloyl-ACP methyl ester carboxylesterase